jgi:hypothetical protein
MNFSKLISYSTDICWNGQGTMEWHGMGKSIDYQTNLVFDYEILGWILQLAKYENYNIL